MVCPNWNQFSCKYQKSNSMWRRTYSVTYAKSGVGLMIRTTKPNEIIRAGLPLVPSQHCCLLSHRHSFAGGLSSHVQGDPLQTQEAHPVLSESRKDAARKKDFQLHTLRLIGLCHVMSSPPSQLLWSSELGALTGQTSPLEADTSSLDPTP